MLQTECVLRVIDADLNMARHIRRSYVALKSHKSHLMYRSMNMCQASLAQSVARRSHTQYEGSSNPAILRSQVRSLHGAVFFPPLSFEWGTSHSRNSRNVFLRRSQRFNKPPRCVGECWQLKFSKIKDILSICFVFTHYEWILILELWSKLL